MAPHPLNPAGIGALGALEPEIVELFDEGHAAPIQPPPGSACQATLDAFCNNATENLGCWQATRNVSGTIYNAPPYFARYDVGASGTGKKAWRCYSHLALTSDHRHPDPHAIDPTCYCTDPDGNGCRTTGHVLQNLRAACEPPPPPPGPVRTKLMLTLRRVFGEDGAPTIWCGSGVQNCRARAVSNDNGSSWADYSLQPQLPDPGVKAGIFRFQPPAGSKAHGILSELASANASVAVRSPGALLFVNANPKLGSSWQDRIRTTVRLSLDNGLSWPFAIEVDARSGYATIAALGDPESVAIIFEDTYGTSASRPFPSACSRFPSPRGICDGGVLISRVNIANLLQQGAWAAPRHSIHAL